MANDNDREIERKYLLRALPAGLTNARSADVDQGYVPGDKIRERVRRVVGSDGTKYFRTVKLGKGVSRYEFEDETTAAFFEAVWPLTRGRRVHKRRYFVPVGDGTWEIDEFLDRDLVLAELETEDADQKIDIPDFITAVLVRDVTDEDEYANYRLAK